MRVALRIDKSFKSKWFVKAICAFALCLLMNSTRGAEGELRWRILEKDSRLVLAALEEGALYLSSGYFWCAPGLGLVHLIFNPNDGTRIAVAELIGTGKYPSVDIVGDKVKGGILDVSHNDLDGWNVTIQFGATSEAFNAFRDTGVMEFKIGNATNRIEFKVGLDQVAKFQDLCRR